MTEGQHKYGDYYYYARGEITLHTEQQPQSQPVVVGGQHYYMGGEGAVKKGDDDVIKIS